ncbi:hypothetical protein Brms1b_012101 [Colletotrichum noveboracense]|nr:hypothetical protein Brms1b_012101 [Colletotrichum noveboracense]
MRQSTSEQFASNQRRWQPGDRNCKNEAIGGSHYGPVIVYLSKVDNAASADGSSAWFKIFEDGWSAKSGAGSGDDDNWGVKDLNACCGKMDVPISKDLVDGDYLLRAEVIALHTAGSSGDLDLWRYRHGQTFDRQLSWSVQGE